MQLPLIVETQNYYTVEEISKEIKNKLEDSYKFIRIRGEVSSLICHRSGHVYFSLKDGDCVLDAIAWKFVAQKFEIPLEDGVEIIGRGYITTFRGRSKYQFVMDSFELAGRGALYAVLEKRKELLQKEGLFDAAHKKPLPKFPRRIGLITSRDGAVLHDIMRRLEERFYDEVLLLPATMQGETCAGSIIQALKELDRQELDVIIIARGGGSFEDLWPFNDEGLCRAIYAAHTPIITAIGHEPDTPLIDYVSDRRAPTPTAAAEMVARKTDELGDTIHHEFTKLKKALIHILQDVWARYMNVLQRFEAKQSLITGIEHRLTQFNLRQCLEMFLANKTAQAQKATIHKGMLGDFIKRNEIIVANTSARAGSFVKYALDNKSAGLQQLAPTVAVARAKIRWRHAAEAFLNLRDRPQDCMERVLHQKNALLEHNASQLRQNGLASILQRGFVVLTGEGRRVFKSTADFKLGETKLLSIHLNDGRIEGELKVKAVEASETQK